jgi:MtaA/CmuA family methyltransferase
MRTLDGKPVDRVPVFPLLMFFAADRAGLTYREFASDGHALADAQLLMQTQYGFDAITACSDAFRLSADMGGEIVFPEDKPPYLARPLVNSRADLDKIDSPDPLAPGSRMADRVLAVSQMASAVGDRVAVLGWVDMPFAEACSICGVSRFMLMLVDDPALAHEVLDRITEAVIDFALAQTHAGAHMIGAGDAAASLVSPGFYSEFVLPYERRVCEAVQGAGGMVKLHICGDTTNLLELMADSGADLFNVDHLVPLARAKEVYAAAGKCFKGNLDPVADMMQSTPEECREKAITCLKIAHGSRYMLSAGCEIPAATSNEVFRAFCEAPTALGTV